MAAFELHLHGIPAAKVTISGGHHFSFHQRLAQGAAGFKCRVVGRLRADHTLANEVPPALSQSLSQVRIHSPSPQP